MNAALRQLTRDKVVGRGWASGTNLEDAAADMLHRAGFRPENVAQQHRVGRFRLDFAFVDVHIALEIDGWHHRSPGGAAKEAARDAWLRSQGWIVLRVDDAAGPDSFLDQLARGCRIVHLIREAER